MLDIVLDAAMTLTPVGKVSREQQGCRVNVHLDCEARLPKPFRYPSYICYKVEKGC